MQRIRCGLVGFGFIGPHHAEAISRLGFAEVVAVCSPRPEIARLKAGRFGIARVYERYEDLITDPEIDVVDIVTPTRHHCPIALAAIAAGKHVIVDKPLALTVREAQKMWEAADAARVVHAVTFNYRFHAIVQHIRALIKRGELGEIRIICGRYLQEWLLYPTDFSWRLDAQQSGEAAMVADAGCHWFDLVEYVSGLRVQSVLADLATLVPVRQRPLGGSREAFSSASQGPVEDYAVTVPDYGATLLRFDNGARGTFTTSPLCAGRKNDLRLEISGSRASVEWIQERSNELWIGRRDEPSQLLLRDPPLLEGGESSLPGGHSEGWPDAFKNTMSAIFAFIASGQRLQDQAAVEFPTFADGLRAAVMAEALVASHRSGGTWTAAG